MTTLYAAFPPWREGVLYFGTRSYSVIFLSVNYLVSLFVGKLYVVVTAMMFRWVSPLLSIRLKLLLCCTC